MEVIVAVGKVVFAGEDGYGFLGVGDSAGKAQTYSNCEGNKCFTHTQRLAVFFYYENSFLCKIVAFYLILGVIGLPEGNL